MSTRSKRAAMLWTGGKDSCLALSEATESGYTIASLVTFAPRNPEFRAHPLHFVVQQAKAMAIPHAVVEVVEPMRNGYEQALRSLKQRYAVDAIITGDIDEIANHLNWIKECANAVDLDLVKPLWKRDRRELLEKLISNGFCAVISCVKTALIGEEWVGTELGAESLARLAALSVEKGFDLCGEQGEYHTLVLDGPLFRHRVRIDQSSVESADSLTYLKILNVSLAVCANASG